jgi:hypothetical protein
MSGLIGVSILRRSLKRYSTLKSGYAIFSAGRRDYLCVIGMRKELCNIASLLRNYRQPPDVVILQCNPKQAMRVANSLLYHEEGPRITANFAGMQTFCGDATNLPLLTGKTSFTLGCCGCRSAGSLLFTGNWLM